MKNSKAKIAIIVIISLIILIVAPTGIYCAVKHESPKSVVSSIFQGTEKKIVGKWQNENGITAWEFFEGGTYDYYLSEISYSGKYSVDKNTITVAPIGSATSSTYKVSFEKDKMTLTLVKDGAIDVEDEESVTFIKVNRFDLKNKQELLDYLKGSVEK